MSSNLPPTGAPGAAGQDQPADPTSGSEVLEQGSGAPLAAPAARRSVKPLVIGGAAVAGLAVAGGAAWAAMSFFSTGAQPAEALPAGTLAYAAVDLDPAGGQKIEAIRTLNKFPAFEEELGLDTDDDLRRRLFEEVHASDGCANLDYARDIEPWLGNRAAAAVVDAKPTVAFALQVTDGEAATAGLGKLRNCAATGDADSAAGPDARVGFAVEGDWAILAEDTDTAERVAADGAASSLADDTTFQDWTARAGDPGIVTVYVAAGARDAALDHAAELFGAVDPMASGSDLSGDPAGADASEGVATMLAGFEGMALTLRFDDGAIELESAGSFGPQADFLSATDRGDDTLATLPADTVAAVGLGFEEGWLRALAEQLDDRLGEVTGEEELSAEELFEELSSQTGLTLPEDVETLAGESLVLAVGPDFDAEGFMASADGADVPVGVKVKGDAARIEAVLDKLRELAGPDASIIGSDAEGDVVAIGPSADYRAELLADGDLGESDSFRDVIREAERAGSIFFLDFDAGDDWLVELSGDDEEARANLAPLSAVGASAWSQDGITHAVLRVATDD